MSMLEKAWAEVDGLKAALTAERERSARLEAALDKIAGGGYQRVETLKSIASRAITKNPTKEQT